MESSLSEKNLSIVFKKQIVMKTKLKIHGQENYFLPDHTDLFT